MKVVICLCTSGTQHNTHYTVSTQQIFVKGEKMVKMVNFVFYVFYQFFLKLQSEGVEGFYKPHLSSFSIFTQMPRCPGPSLWAHFHRKHQLWARDPTESLRADPRLAGLCTVLQWLLSPSWHLMGFSQSKSGTGMLPLGQTVLWKIGCYRHVDGLLSHTYRLPEHRWDRAGGFFLKSLRQGEVSPMFCELETEAWLPSRGPQQTPVLLMKCRPLGGLRPQAATGIG